MYYMPQQIALLLSKYVCRVIFSKTKEYCIAGHMVKARGYNSW